MGVRMKCLLTLPVLFLLAVPASAQIDATKGDTFTLMVPPSVMYEDGICALCNGWSGNPTPIFSADITPETIWVGEFPTLVELQFEKIDTGRDDYVEAELRNPEVAIKLRLHTDHSSVQAVFARAAVAGGAASEATQLRLARVYDQIAAGVFQGGLGIVPPDLRVGLLQHVHTSFGGTSTLGHPPLGHPPFRLGHATFRRDDYLVVDLGRHPNMYNTRRHESHRVARILNQRLLNWVKETGAWLEGTGLAGIRVELEIPHRPFVSEDDDAEAATVVNAADLAEAGTAVGFADVETVDRMILYVLATDARMFADFEMTNQEFVDACVIIVNGNRIAVRLADG